jgi:hypothetical protein
MVRCNSLSNDDSMAKKNESDAAAAAGGLMGNAAEAGEMAAGLPPVLDAADAPGNAEEGSDRGNGGLAKYTARDEEGVFAVVDAMAGGLVGVGPRGDTDMAIPPTVAVAAATGSTVMVSAGGTAAGAGGPVDDDDALATCDQSGSSRGGDPIST